MVTWNLSDVNAYEARQHQQPKSSGGGVEHEVDLHDQIADFCRARGWLALHARMDMPCTLTVGAPDFIILCDNGKTLYVECKRKGGKLSVKQQALHAWAARLGHTVHVVQSIEEFLVL